MVFVGTFMSKEQTEQQREIAMKPADDGDSVERLHSDPTWQQLHPFVEVRGTRARALLYVCLRY